MRRTKDRTDWPSTPDERSSEVCGLHIRYRPGWSFAATDCKIEATYHADNVLAKYTTITITLPLYCRPRDLDRQGVIDAIVELIGRIEEHERLEWLRIDGEKAFDLHPNGPNDFQEGRALLAEHRARLVRTFGIGT